MYKQKIDYFISDFNDFIGQMKQKHDKSLILITLLGFLNKNLNHLNNDLKTTLTKLPDSLVSATSLDAVSDLQKFDELSNKIADFLIKLSTIQEKFNDIISN